MTPMKKIVADALFRLLLSQTRSHYDVNTDNKQKSKEWSGVKLELI